MFRASENSRENSRESVMQEPEAVHLFHLSSFHVDTLMCLHLPSPKIYQLIGLADVEQQPVRCLSPGCL